jgi:hypothetical protein
MKKFSNSLFRIALLLIPVICLAGVNAAGWIGFGSNIPEKPLVQLNKSAWDGIDLRVQIQGLQAEEVKTKGGVFTRLSFEQDMIKGEVGSPRLPVIRKIVTVPYGAEIALEVNPGT